MSKSANMLNALLLMLKNLSEEQNNFINYLLKEKDKLQIACSLLRNRAKLCHIKISGNDSCIPKKIEQHFEKNVKLRDKTGNFILL